MTEKERREEAEDFLYRFPTWIDVEMKQNFFDMWRAFKRTPVDYYMNEATQMNGKECIGDVLIGKGAKVVGEYYHKWNNIGWIFFDGKVYHVSSAKLL